MTSSSRESRSEELRAEEWFEDSTLWNDLFPFMFPETSFERAIAEAERVKELVGAQGGRLLDMPCGPGRHTLPLARLGFQVTGVDLTVALLDRARGSAARDGLDVEWVHADMRTFRRTGAFDVALNAFTSLGYFSRWDDNVQVVRNVYDSLKPRGTFLLETIGKEGLARIFLPVSTSEMEDGRLLIERRRVVDAWRRIENEWLLLEGDRVIRRFHIDHWIYSAGELIDMLAGVGFGDIQTYAGFSDQPYDHRAKRLLVVGRK